MAWYNLNWSYRKLITFDNTRVVSTETDFPVLVHLASDLDISAEAQADGDDILFTSSDGTTKLDHEIEKYVTGTGELIAWVKIPSLSSTVDTDIYIYYGHVDISNQENPAGVWDSNYKGVWHLKESGNGTADEFVDSSGTGNHGQGDTAPTQVTSGKIGNAQDFNGTANEIDLGTSSTLRPAAVTVSAWAKREGTGDANAWQDIIGCQEYNSNGYLLTLQPETTDVLWRVNGGGVFGTSATVTTSNWHSYTGTFSGTTSKLYVDGVLQGTNSSASLGTAGTNGVAIGNDAPGNTQGLFDGLIDEVRISNIARSASWIETEYNNQNSPGTFYSLGSEENVPATGITYERTAGAMGANFNLDIGTAGTDRLVTIHIGEEQASLIGITAVTVDGKSCTKLHDIVNTLGAGNAQQFWYITESTLGSSNGTVSVAFTGTWDTGHRAQAMLHTGVQDGAPHDSGYDNTSGAVGTVTVTGIDCPANGLVVAGWGQGQMAPDTITSITSPHTSRFIEVPTSATLAGSSGVETVQQTNKTYVLDWNTTDGFRQTGIVATWAAAEVSAPTQTHQMMI